jgi:predicted DNA-binding WGR domain protein
MVFELLHRIDQDRNMARFYGIEVKRNLFGDVCVLRSWGRIGTFGRTNIETCASAEDAARTASRTLCQKMRRGYLPTLHLLSHELVD